MGSEQGCLHLPLGRGTGGGRRWERAWALSRASQDCLFPTSLSEGKPRSAPLPF